MYHAADLLMRERFSSPMEQWPSFADTQVHSAAVIFLGWHLCSSPQTQKAIWPQSMGLSARAWFTPRAPGKPHSVWAEVEPGAWDEEEFDSCGWILHYFNAESLIRVRCCSPGFWHFVSAVQARMPTFNSLYLIPAKLLERNEICLYK